ncbi:unnamed protein product [marine sediment metagenome]|uniref:Uncharacterized protein n=1 Tax=marine sediment metagenome TaxID=412755 RepID=X1NF48_9ZZZZ
MLDNGIGCFIDRGLENYFVGNDCPGIFTQIIIYTFSTLFFMLVIILIQKNLSKKIYKSPN